MILALTCKSIRRNIFKPAKRELWRSIVRREIIFTIVILAGVCGADTITVNWDGTGDYTTIQGGIEAAVDGDIVLVADGTYTGTGNREIDFLGKAVTVRSQNGPDNCIIDCEGLPSETHIGFIFVRGEGLDSVLEGLTITNCYWDEGSAVYFYSSGATIRGCKFINNSASYMGGAISFGTETVAEIEECTFYGNTARYGGAVYYFGADVLIKNCEFTGNTAVNDGGAITSDWTGSGNIRIMGCEFTGNSAGVDGLGGAVHIGTETVAEIAGCTFSDNTAPNGGAVCCEGIAEIEGCQILGNSAFYGGGVSAIGDVTLSRNVIKQNEATYGGGIWIDSYGQCSIDNSLIAENNAEMYGGGLRARGEADLRITDSTICNNTAETGGGLYVVYEAFCRIANSIIWGNDALGGKQIYAVASGVSLLNCDISNNFNDIEYSVSMTDCIHVAPLFAGPDDYSLQASSPCIDTGNNDYMVGYKDLAGQYRPLDGDGDATATVDMGAYEFCPEGESVIQCSDDYICFTHFITGQSDDEQSIIISNTGDGLLDWTISEDIPWLEVSPAGGTTGAEGVEVVLSVDASLLSQGVYSGALSIIDPDAMNSPFQIQVSLCVVGDGLWVPYNYPRIQDAIDAASAGQTVFVADGMYTGYGNRDIDFLGKAITVRSTTGAENCIVNCMASESEPYTAFKFISGEGNNSVLDGFTLTGAYSRAVNCDGTSPTISNCIIRDNEARGVYCYNGAPIITNCLFSSNIFDYWGGVFLRECSGPVSISNCRFIQNGTAVYVRDSMVIITDSTIKSNGGGGIFHDGGSVIIERCVIESNNNCELGGGVFSNGEELIIRDSVVKDNQATRGGGVFARYGTVEISNCQINDNKADYCLEGPLGGGIYCYSCDVSILGCTINGNYCVEQGGGVCLRSCDGLISSCLVAGNYGVYDGGGIYIDDESDIDIDSCTIVENRSQGDVAGVLGATTVTNCILWRNDAWGLDNYQLIVAFTDYCVIGRHDSSYYTFLNYGGVGNTGADPMFVQDGYWDDAGTENDWDDDTWVEGDYSLQEESPCIDSGPVESFWSAADYDVTGQYRPLDGDEDAEAAPDMGAYEYVPGTGPVIRVSQQRVYFTHETGGTGSYQETITIYNSGDEILNWTIEEDCPWLTASPADGVCDENEIEVLLTVDTEGLAPDVYLYPMQICDASALNSPFEVAVVLYVVPADGFWVPFNYETIQAAVDAAIDGDTVIVADGVYTGEGNRGIDYGGKGIIVKSPCGPENCTIDCEGLPGGRAFLFITGEGPDSILQGFTVKSRYSEYTAGVLCMNESHPTIKDCVFVGNASYYHDGGALRCLDYSSPQINGCIFVRNVGGLGGAVYCKGDEPSMWNPEKSEPVLTNCKFLSNRTYGHGGGAYFEQSYPTISGCSFVGNNCDDYGGGGYFLNCEPVITNCIFKNNQGSSGSGVYARLSDITLTGSLFSGNRPDSGLRAYECQGTLSNSTFVGNKDRGASVWEVAVSNCVFWENYKYQVSAESVTYSDVQGGKEGEGNIDAEPLFTEAGYWDDHGTEDYENDDFWVEGDYHLSAGSPCIDAGDPDYPIDPAETDLDGNLRVMDGDADGNPRIDMGAYEYQFMNLVETEMSVTPRVLNVAGNGPWVNCSITIPEGVEVDELDPDLILFLGEITAAEAILNHDGTVIEIRFDRLSINDYLIEEQLTGEVELEVIVELSDGTILLGKLLVEVIGPALSGNGTEANPYLIQSLVDFDLFASDPNYWATNIYTRLEIDIDLFGRTYSKAVIAPDKDLENSFQGIAFEGFFDGAGHEITNLTIDTEGADNSYLGLFGCVASGGEIKNLGLKDVIILGGEDSRCLGGLCGCNKGRISSCCSTGVISGGSGSSVMGGLVGINTGSVISNCYSNCDVFSEGSAWYSGDIGGLCGANSDGTIYNCYATGAVSGGLHAVGGLCGYNSGMVYLSYWDIQTSGLESSAGGIGLTTTEMMNINTYTGWGDNVWTIDDGNDYPRLVWEGHPGEPIINAPRTYSGGSGSSEDPYFISTPDDMITLGIYSDDWDKHYKLTNDVDMADFVFNTFLVPEFSGVFNGDGHTISNLTIETINQYDNSKYLALFGKVTGEQAEVKNLRLEDISITGGHSSDYLGGLCGYNEYGTISNCCTSGSVTDSDDSYNSYYLGGLCGFNFHGTINNCYSICLVAGEEYIGGLCGWNEFGNLSESYAAGSIYGTYHVGGLCGYNTYGIISGSYATGRVNGSYYIGGLCGWNEFGQISNCYATGSVGSSSGLILSRYHGGLCGENYQGTINNCYSTGLVLGSYDLGGLCGHQFGNYAEMKDCFWDTDTSEMIVGYNLDPDEPGIVTNVIGMTTTQMQTMSTFTDADWDFVNIWAICEGTNYPRFIWQIPAGDIVCPDGVDSADLLIMSSQWLQPPGTPSADIAPETPDGIVNLEDFEILAENWLEGY
jgi:predicted outer membrane repeat protein